jgi:signal transduction histidine kinase
LLFIIEDATRAGQLEQQLVQERNELRLAQASLAQTNAELERLNRLKSIFLSISAHELRAPLTAIGVYLDLILADLPPDAPTENTHYLSTVRTQLDRLDKLVGDLLDLDTLEQGKLSIYPGACDLNCVVRQVTEIVAGWAHQQGLSIALDLGEADIQVEADPERLSQITYNLISNAIKYTQEGGTIQISTWAEPLAGVLRLRTMARISPSEIEHLFELYYRTKGSGQSRSIGSGLGLYIVKSLVEAMHGQIEVNSELGRGTEIQVRLPCALVVQS